jgi:hypothetical protein
MVNLFSLAMCYCGIIHDMRVCVVTTLELNFQFLYSEPLLHVVYEFFETLYALIIIFLSYWMIIHTKLLSHHELVYSLILL